MLVTSDERSLWEARANRARAAGSDANPGAGGVEDDGPDADFSEGDGDSGSESGENPGPGPGDAPGQAMRHDVNPQVDGPDYELDPEIAAEWQEAAQAPVPNLYWNLATYQVHEGGSSAGAILGRIKPMKENTPGECVSVYCRRHGCTKIVKARDAPHTENLMRWFEEGLAIPMGRDRKRQHMELWPQ